MNLVSILDNQSFRTAFNKIPNKYLEMSEEEIREIASPSKTDYSIRHAFWNEFRLCHSNTGESFTPSRVHAGICTYQNWYHNILNNPKKLAWIIQPVQGYKESLQPLFIKLAEKYYEILDLDIYDKKGRPVPALVKQVIEVMKMLEGTKDEGEQEKMVNKVPVDESALDDEILKLEKQLKLKM